MESFSSLLPDCIGKSIEVPTIGSIELDERVQRGELIKWEELKSGKRIMRPRLFTKDIPLYSDDAMFMGDLQLTVSHAINELRPAAKRRMDQVILGVNYDKKTKTSTIIEPGGVDSRYTGICGGILGKNYTGNDGVTTTPFNPNMVVPADYINKGTKAGAGMIIDKIAYAKQLLMETDAWDIGSGEVLCMAITPQQYTDLLMLEQSQNKNYGFNCLENGIINKFLGINFLITNILPKNADGARICPMWVKSRIKFGLWRDASVKISGRTDYKDIETQVSLNCAYGATRIDEESCVQILCKEVD